MKRTVQKKRSEKDREGVSLIKVVFHHGILLNIFLKFSVHAFCGTAEVEIRLPSADNPDLRKSPLNLKPLVGQNIDCYASPAARNSAVPTSAFSAHSTSFSLQIHFERRK